MGTRSPAVDRYLQHIPTAHRQAFEVIRDLIHSIQPDVTELVHYNMPLFDYNGLLCSFSSQIHSMSLFCKSEVLERYRAELSKVEIGKGRIRFKRLDDLPLETLRAILRDCCAALEKPALPVVKQNKGQAE